MLTSSLALPDDACVAALEGAIDRGGAMGTAAAAQFVLAFPEHPATHRRPLERLLLQALDEDDPTVVQALGAVGGRASLEALRALASGWLPSPARTVARSALAAVESRVGQREVGALSVPEGTTGALSTPAASGQVSVATSKTPTGRR